MFVPERVQTRTWPDNQPIVGSEGGVDTGILVLVPPLPVGQTKPELAGLSISIKLFLRKATSSPFTFVHFNTDPSVVATCQEEDYHASPASNPLIALVLRLTTVSCIYNSRISDTGSGSPDGASLKFHNRGLLRDVVESSTTWVALLGSLVVTTLYQVNRLLNYLSRNSWAIKNSREWDWPTEIAVITGGSGGIGTAIVEELVALGVRVAVLDIQELPASLQNHPCVSYFSCNLNDSSAVAAAAQAIEQKIGHPSILINNAGILQSAPILETPETLLRNIFNINCISMWFPVQQFLPHMIKQNKGHIVTMASICSFAPVAASAAYCASKAGAMAFHEVLSVELLHYHKTTNVLTTIVHPSHVRTPMIKHIIKDVDRAGLQVLSPREVATEVVKQLRRREGGFITLPWFVSIVSTTRSWPHWTRQLMQSTVGRKLAAMEVKNHKQVATSM